jgi:hypothetical protein
VCAYYHRQLHDYESLHDKASSDEEAFVGNPLNSYLLIKKMTADWKTLQVSLSRAISIVQMTSSLPQGSYKLLSRANLSSKSDQSEELVEVAVGRGLERRRHWTAETAGLPSCASI